MAYGSITVENILYVLLGNISALGLWAADGLLALAAAAKSEMIMRTGMRKWRKTYLDAQELESASRRSHPRTIKP